MPAAIPTTRERITKFTNCRLLKGDALVKEDLWVSSGTGKIVRSQAAFYGENVVPNDTIDLGGRIVSPGLIDVQLNGAFGFDFSVIPDDPASYGKTLRLVNKSLVNTGVTSYLPTLTSQKSEVYHQVIVLSCLFCFFAERERPYHIWVLLGVRGSQKMDPSPWVHTARDHF